MYTNNEKEDIKIRASVMGLLIVLLFGAYFLIKYQVDKESKQTTASYTFYKKVLGGLKYDSVTVHFDSLEGKCIGSDYTFYCDSVKYWVVTKAITPLQPVVDTQYYCIEKGKPARLLKKNK